MTSLLVRNLDEDLVRRLKERAVAHGRSAEAEHRAILEAALAPKRTGRDLWESLRRGAPMDIDFDAANPDQTPDIPDFR